MQYLYKEAGKVSFEDRCAAYSQKPYIFWFTGLSGSGKSTIADTFEKELFDRGRHVFSLDADNLRKKLNSDLGFTMEDRAENIRRAAEIARLFQDAGIIVLATFISPMQAMRDQAREFAREGMFFEIYIKASLETCRVRDPKGFYEKAKNGEIKNYTGITSTYEIPESPDLVLDTEVESIEQCVKKLLHLAHQSGMIKEE